MKKLFALLLALVLVFPVFSAVAETATGSDVIEVPAVENGTVVPFADHNFQITLPSDWNVLEVTDDQAATGIFFNCANPESTRSFTIAYSEFEAATDIQSVAEALATTYENVQLVTINDIPFVSYVVSESDVMGIAPLNASGIGMYQFVFYPASDTDYSTLAEQIAASINTIE